MSRSVRVILALVLLMALGQAVSLVRRGSRGDTDFGVFYRTTVLLGSGIGGDLYPRDDAVTHWPISLAPAGLAIFQPLASLGLLGASVGWALVNLLLLGLSITSLRRFLSTIDPVRGDLLTAWGTILLLVLAAGSLQVGQFSVLFVACWIVALSALAAGRDVTGTVLLALPSAIKLYPVLMLAVPLSVAATIRTGRRHVLAFLVGMAVFSLLVPTVAYGRRAWDLNVSFWDHVILSPTGQVPYMQQVRTGSNQSLDTVALRYLTHDPDFHVLFPSFPHLQYERAAVLPYLNGLRLTIFIAAVATVLRWRRRGGLKAASEAGARAYDLMMMSALWSCTLYLILPETKARYAVYTTLGFLPPLVAAVAAHRSTTKRLLRIVEMATCAILIVGLVPESMRTYGLGLVGALLLWAANLRLAWGFDALPVGAASASLPPPAGDRSTLSFHQIRP